MGKWCRMPQSKWPKPMAQHQPEAKVEELYPSHRQARRGAAVENPLPPRRPISSQATWISKTPAAGMKVPFRHPLAIHRKNAPARRMIYPCRSQALLADTSAVEPSWKMMGHSPSRYLPPGGSACTAKFKKRSPTYRNLQGSQVRMGSYYPMAKFDGSTILPQHSPRRALISIRAFPSRASVSQARAEVWKRFCPNLPLPLSLSLENSNRRRYHSSKHPPSQAGMS
jgi:hypothetical protein